MNQLSTRELLYLEDVCKMFESVAKTCEFAAGAAVDPNFKSYLQSMRQEHMQWISTTASLVNNTGKH